MKFTGAVILVALALPAAAWAQTDKPDVSSAPSAKNSGAGIAGQPGSKSGPAAKPGETVGSSSTSPSGNTAVQSQDPANVQGAPGNKSGPPAKRPETR
ncbi:hypothetical protein JQ607_13365 [Bradyrhizobium liaoningense]|uniref:hypothetical protein n=1 Tax=Bradyrhizobium liaoningense TaxID=43992 RepID=UPI001BA95216|nr:hypothetical protein [Bradyrhizobium liaoningense]MBR0841180.1 hypothetical protein [Bradyrhizobium liaoningense]MBR0853137.1 hypothetical protein [Bradyrhizobium liaoningense]